MKPLPTPDSQHLQAAQGWCELHAFAEADAELDEIAASLRTHPKVLEVRWQIYANLEKWAGALDIANAMVKMVPEWPSGWIYRGQQLDGIEPASGRIRDTERGGSPLSGDEIIPYDLACLCCALKRFDEARESLAKAIKAGGNQIKQRAMDDQDLEPLWKNISEI